MAMSRMGADNMCHDFLQLQGELLSLISIKNKFIFQHSLFLKHKLKAVSSFHFASGFAVIHDVILISESSFIDFSVNVDLIIYALKISKSWNLLGYSEIFLPLKHQFCEEQIIQYYVVWGFWLKSQGRITRICQFFTFILIPEYHSGPARDLSTWLIIIVVIVSFIPAESPP